MTIISFVEKHKLAEHATIVLYHGKNSSGRDFFAYLLCSAKGLRLLEADAKEQSAPRDIGDYGTVIYIDFRTSPDSKAEAFLEKYRMESSKTDA